MRKNEKINRSEPKNAPHGKTEQSRVQGKRGSGIKSPTRPGPGEAKSSAQRKIKKVD